MNKVQRAGAIIFLCLACRGQQADVTTIRLLAEKLHAAYAARDLDAVDGLWSGQSPDKAAHREATQRLFTSSASLAESTVRDPEVAGDRARLRVDRDVAGAPESKLTMEWVRESSDWKIWKETPAAQELAARLAALPAGEKPDALLAANDDISGADLAQALIDQGTAARNRGDTRRAVAMLELAGSIAERAGSRSARALALNGLGLVLYDQGEYPRAMESYRASFELSQQAHDDAGASRALSNLSAVYSLIGDLTTASEYLEKSLATAEKLRDDRLITNALGNMAVLNARRGDYMHALALLQRCRDLLSGGGDKRGMAANLNNIGNVYLWQGDLEQARDYFGQELEVARSADLKPLVAVAWMGLGRVAEFRGDLRTAIANYEKTLGVLNETGNKPFAASDLTFIGSAYSMMRNEEKALEFYHKGLEIQKAIRAGSEAALTMGRIAEVYNRKGDFAKAREAAGEAHEMANAAGLREAEWRADLQAGRAEQGLGETAKAEKRFRDAVATIEELRQGVGGGETQQESFFESKLEPYHRLAGILIASGRTPEAFEFAERAKARVLTDVLRNGRAELTTLMSAEERAKDQELRVRLASLNTRLMRARSGGAATQVPAITAELTRARAEYEGFQNELYLRNPRWKATGGDIDPATGKQALALAAEPKTVFLEFVVTDDKVYVFVAQPSHELKAFSEPISQEALKAQVRQFQRQLAERNLGFRTASSALYQTLIAPAHLDLASTRHLVIVPDGVLWELPFQALSNPQGRYLLDDCSVSYAPSLTALKTMMEVKRLRKSSPAGTQLLAMGDPAVERGLEGRVKALYREETLEALPAAKTEVQSLGRIYGEHSRVYVGGEARESRFKAEAGGARVLHLATHAVLNNASPLYSYLLLAGEQGGAEDGLLEARELLTMNLNAELAVLSACETARGHVGEGEGMIGLSWALLVSGVPTTVLSQWRVASESTSTFMTDFHQNRRKAMNDADALRAAALSLRKNPAYQHPFYWAPFTLIGAGLN